MQDVKRKGPRHTMVRCHQHTREDRREGTEDLQAIKDIAAIVSPCPET